MATEAARLLAPGVNVVLKDGVTRALVIDFQTAILIEEEFDGLDVFLERLQARTWSTKLRTVSRGLALCLEKAKHRPEGLEPGAVVGLLDGRQLRTYIEALLEAIDQFLPEPTSSGDEGPKAASGDDSRGPGSTTSGLSVMDGPSGSSGE